ncbi:transcriptional regulator, LuxR family [Sulfobacillus acidophilus TPY]|nr:transcriptional regulator, LuxR family [Sulfobacillus acidophilus TPY]
MKYYDLSGGEKRVELSLYRPFGVSISVFRLVLPVLCFIAVISHPHFAFWAVTIGVVTFIDALTQWRWGKTPDDPHVLRHWTWRDAGYALWFYLAYLKDAQVPALLLAPLVIMEAYFAYPRRFTLWFMAIEGILLGIRMSVMAWLGHPLIHPGWPIGIILATGIACLLAGTIQERHHALVKSARVQQHARWVVSSILHHTGQLTGIGELLALSQRWEHLVTTEPELPDPRLCQELAQQLAGLILMVERQQQLLTERERDVLQLIQKGLSYREIATRLRVSDGTVRAHAGNLMRKANVHTRQELVDWAQSHYLLPKPLDTERRT